MVVGRSPREIGGFRYEKIIDSIDWNRVLLQAVGEHEREHSGLGVYHTCGECIKSVLLRREEF